jgi:LysM repeat protein
VAKYRYRPYRKTARTSKSRNLRFFILSLIVIVIGVIILYRSRDTGGDEKIISTDAGQTGKESLPPFEFKPEQIAKKKQTNVMKSEPYSKIVIEPELKPKPGTAPKPGISPESEISIPADGDKTSSEVVTLVAEANKDLSTGQVIAARDKFNQLLSMQLSSQDLVSVKNKLAGLSRQWLFSRDIFPGDTLTGSYAIQPGDRLTDIGKKYKVPYEILMTINDIRRPEMLRAGEKIKVINGPFHAIIHRSSFTMDLYLGNKTYVKTYRIGLGTADKETPTGRWRVKDDGKLISPPWPNPEGGIVQPNDPEYPLGSRWIGLDGLEGNAKGRTGFALHGTKDPETIGIRSSQGCIRLYNGEVIEVYNMFMPGLSEVLVVD